MPSGSLDRGAAGGGHTMHVGPEMGEEGVGNRGTHAAAQLTNEGMTGCADGTKGSNGKDYKRMRAGRAPYSSTSSTARLVT